MTASIFALCHLSTEYLEYDFTESSKDYEDNSDDNYEKCTKEKDSIQDSECDSKYSDDYVENSEMFGTGEFRFL